jgi:long-chain acyl-CoA synthetase
MSHRTLLDEIQRRVESVNSHLANVEKVRRWTVLPAEFAVGVELTPTFKVRRKVVAERFAAEIESLYEQPTDGGDDKPLPSRRPGAG